MAQAARALENGRTLVLASIIRSLGDLSALQDWIDAGAKGTFVADCRITSSVRAPWLSEWTQASEAAKAAVAG